MTIESYTVFIPYNGKPLTAEVGVDRVVDPFDKQLTPSNFFPIADWSMDVEQTLNIGSQSSGAGAGKIAFNPFTITRRIDWISPSLFLHAASGTPFQYVDLIQRHIGKNATSGAVFLAWRFGLTAVKTVSWAHDTTTAMETVSFEFGSLSIDYHPQRPNGSLGKLYSAGWDRVRNVQLP